MTLRYVFLPIDFTKLAKAAIVIVCCFMTTLTTAEANGDLTVSGVILGDDLAIANLDCTALANGGKLTTNIDGLVVCADDDGTTGPHTVDTDTQLSESEVDAFVANNGYSTGPHTVDTDTTLSEGEVDAFVANNGYSSGPHTVDIDTTCSFSACIEPGITTLTCGANSLTVNCVMPGSLWTARSATETAVWESVTYGGGLFVAVNQNGTNQVMTSPDGITWTARSAAEANWWRSVTYGDGLFVAVAGDGTNRVMTSPDGITWTARSAAEANGWRSLTYGGGLFVAVASNGTNQVMTSRDY